MISRIRVDSIKQFALQGFPPLAIALVTAEHFFKFGSFTLECTAFLALWYGLDWAYSRLPGLRSRPPL